MVATFHYYTKSNMWRFLIVSAVGALGILGGQAVLCLGLYPSALAPIATLFQGAILLVLGTALFVSGMLGLAQGYEQVAGTLKHLLNTKDTTENPPAVADSEQLVCRNDSFWRAYQRSAVGICLFLGGLLALVIGLDRYSFNLYVTAVGSGIGILGLATFAFLIQGLKEMRKTHREVLQSSAALERLPDLSDEEVPRPRSRPRIARRYTLFEKNRGSGTGRSPRLQRQDQLSDH